MKLTFAQRVQRPDFQGEFVKTMLVAAASPNIISFAGGLPNPVSFPVKEMEAACTKVLEENGVSALQYSTTQGYKPLREFIAKRYEKIGAKVEADDILITNGSQQALDIIGAVLLDEGDDILLERPSYLAALQMFHLYGPKVHTVELCEGGIDCDELKSILDKVSPKFFYAIPNFQNPTGLTYSAACREKTAAILKGTNTIFIEDNPYGELRFRGENQKSMQAYLGSQCMMLGTFSKTVSPGIRIGWICCRIPELMQKMLEYKQMVDLHTNVFCQMVLAQYLKDNDLDVHMEKIKALYQAQADAMMSCMDKYLPAEVTYTKPEGGMFIWATLPAGCTAVELANRAAKAGVAIAAGDPFYEKDRNVRTLRLNYSNCTPARIDEGMQILGRIIREMQK